MDPFPDVEDKILAIEELVKIKNRDPNSMTPEDYNIRNNVNAYLFGTPSLHDAFARRYPEHCLATVIWIDQYGSLNRLQPSDDTEIYTADGIFGAAIRVHPKENNLAACLADARYDSNSVYLYFDEHSNILWLDPVRQEIHRFDPQIPKTAPEARPIDSGLQDFFSLILPEYTYLGNTLTTSQCVQNVRRNYRQHLDCFCQEYTLLYALNRLSGMQHQAAAQDLIFELDRIEDRIEDLYLDLAGF